MFYRPFYVPATLHTIELYSLIARCLKGKPTPDDAQRLEYLLKSDPCFRKDYDLFKTILENSLSPDEGHFNDQQISEKFNHITQRLIDEGSLRP